MDDKIKNLFNIAIEIEELMEKLYLYYSETFTEYSNFFIEIAKEESEHAELLQTIFKLKEMDINIKNFNLSTIDNLLEFKNNIELTLNKVKEKKPSLKEACLIALNFENSASELHVQDIIINSEDKYIKNIIKFLGIQDKYHSDKILNFIKKNNIF